MESKMVEKYVKLAVLYSCMVNMDGGKEWKRLVGNVRREMVKSERECERRGYVNISDRVVAAWGELGGFVDYDLDIGLVMIEVIEGNREEYKRYGVNVKRISDNGVVNRIYRSRRRLRLAKEFYRELREKMGDEFGIEMGESEEKGVSEIGKRIYRESEWVRCNSVMVEESDIEGGLNGIGIVMDEGSVPLGVVVRYDERDCVLCVVPGYMVIVDIDTMEMVRSIGLRDIVGMYSINSNIAVGDGVVSFCYRNEKGKQYRVWYRLDGGEYEVKEIEKRDGYWIDGDEIVGYSDGDDMSRYDPLESDSVRHSYVGEYMGREVFRYVKDGKVVYGYRDGDNTIVLDGSDVKKVRMWGRNPYRPKQKLYVEGKWREPVMIACRRVRDDYSKV